jgi:putative ABC transport system ATP-binding protein
MNETSPDQSAEQLQTLLVWATEVIAGEVITRVDPVEVRRSVRAALEGRTRLDGVEAVAALGQVLRAMRLVLAEASDVVGSMGTVALPLVTLAGGGVALASRRAGKIEVKRPNVAPDWVSVEQARELVSTVGGTWLTAAPAAPLEELSAAHHDGEHLSPLQRLRALMSLERDDLWIIVIYAAAVGLFTLATPIAVQSLVGSVAFGTVLQPIVVLSLLLLAALAFQAGLKALQTRVVESVEQRVFARTALDLAWRLPRVKLEAEGYGPEVANKFFDVMTVQKSGTVLLTDGISTVLQIAIGLLVLGFYHPFLLAFDIVLIALVALVVFAPVNRGMSTSINESYAKYEVAEWLQQLARMGGTFRSTSGAALALDRADALTRRYLTARAANFQVIFGQTIGTFGLQVLASAALLGLGGWLVLQRELTLGQLVAAEIIVGAVTGSVAKMGKLISSAYDLFAALDKIGHVLDLPVEDAAASEPIPGQGALHVEVSGLTHEGRTLSFEVKANQRVALVAPPGCALAEVLSGVRAPSTGHVSLNGVETARARNSELHEQVMVVRPTGLFSGTLLENVLVGRDRLTAAEVRVALQRVDLLEEVRALPQGLDTRLDAEGRPLDSSQVLRLMLARAIALSPRLLIIDASLDGFSPRVRATVLATLCRDNPPWTLIALVQDPQSPMAKACGRLITLDAPASAEDEKGA